MHVLHKAYPNTYLFSSLPLKIFGCTTFVHNQGPKIGKSEPKAQKCISLSYSPNQKRYKCYCPTNKKYICMFRRAYLSLKINPFVQILLFRERIHAKGVWNFLFCQSEPPSYVSHESKSSLDPSLHVSPKSEFDNMPATKTDLETTTEPQKLNQ